MTGPEFLHENGVECMSWPIFYQLQEAIELYRREPCITRCTNTESCATQTINTNKTKFMEFACYH